MSKKRKRSRKKKEAGRMVALKSFGAKVWFAASGPPKYIWERIQLNREIYLGREGLVKTVREKNRRIEELRIRYRMHAAYLPYNDRELGFGTTQRMEFVGNVAQGAIEAAVPAKWWVRRLRHPANAELARISDRLQAAIAIQEELIGLFERITTRKGSETPIEAAMRELAERDENERRRAEEQDRILRFNQNRTGLVQAFEGLKSSQEDDPITAGTRLDFQAVETFVKEVLAEADGLLGKGKPAPEEDHIASLEIAVEDVKFGFAYWAAETAKRQSFFDDLLGVFEEVEERHGEISPPPEIIEISDVFRKEVPKLWADAHWTELKVRLADVQGMTNHLAEIARGFREWGQKISEIQARVAETEELRSRLADEYGESVPPSEEWTAAWKAFQQEGIRAFATGEWENLYHRLEAIEEPLRKNEYKVRSALERLSTYVNGHSANGKDEDVTRGAGTRHARLRAKAAGGDDDILAPDLK